VTIEDQRFLFEKGHVASIGAFGAVRSDAGAAFGGVELSRTLSITALFFMGAYK
jgi:hypothetical protein